MKQDRHDYPGGREDDITVMVAQYHKEVQGQPRLTLNDDHEYFIKDKYLYTTADGTAPSKVWVTRA